MDQNIVLEFIDSGHYMILAADSLQQCVWLISMRHSRLKLESSSSNMLIPSSHHSRSKWSNSCYRGISRRIAPAIEALIFPCQLVLAAKGLMKTSGSCWNRTPHLCSSVPYLSAQASGSPIGQLRGSAVTVVALSALMGGMWYFK